MERNLQISELIRMGIENGVWGCVSGVGSGSGAWDESKTRPDLG